MGRELKRVPLDFSWPLNERWSGFVNDLAKAAKPCAPCNGRGYSPFAQNLHDLWYGCAPFKPEDRGSVPFLATDAPVRIFAERNCKHSPDFYGTSEAAISREAARLISHWNGCWSKHLNTDDVAALVAAGRLYDLTHTWTRAGGWKPNEPSTIPTPRQVGEWAISTMGHDSINASVVIRAECKRLAQPLYCAVCNGEGEIWPSEEARQASESWQPTEPPVGDGYQIWETVSEGSPISPVFSTPEDLARHMETTRWGADEGTPYETWLAFIRGPGWAPSMIMESGTMMSGVEGVIAPSSA